MGHSVLFVEEETDGLFDLGASMFSCYTSCPKWCPIFGPRGLLSWRTQLVGVQ